MDKTVVMPSGEGIQAGCDEFPETALLLIPGIELKHKIIEMARRE